MTTEQYIQEELLKIQSISSQPYSDKRESISNRIYRVLTRSAFRSGKVDPEVKSFMQEHIETQVKANLPVRIHYGMGGARGINTYNFPHLNWAEYLHLQFLHRNLLPIADIYEPGIEIVWSPDDSGVLIINNYKQEWVDTFLDEFPQLLEYFNKKLPDNFKHVFKPASQWHNQEELRIRIKNIVDRMLEDRKGSEEVMNHWYLRGKNNYYIEEGTSTEEAEKQIRMSTIANQAWLEADFEVRDEFWGSGIGVAHFSDFPGTLLIRVLKDSVIQFWKANGFLKIREEKVKPQIVSRKNWAEVFDQLEFIDFPNQTGLECFDKLPVLKQG